MRALLSVYDKEGIIPFATELQKLGYELVSSGGTYDLLAEAGIPVMQVSEVTGFPECLDGRVKTLHPRIHAGILANRALPTHMETLTDLDIKPIDIVVVNLYPFKSVIADPTHTLADAIENIDIGGPSMIRAAAKNYQAVSILCDPADYSMFLAELKDNTITEARRLQLATKAFTQTAAYDTMISNYLVGVQSEGETELFPEHLTLHLTKKQSLRYGENPHQAAAYYVEDNAKNVGLEHAEILHGKELSYNNISDAQHTFELLQEFIEPACVAVKHATPCGVAIGATVFEAFEKAYASDPVSIFGGIVCVNRTVDAATAEKMSKIFLEVIIAPDYDIEALEILKQKKNVRILKMPMTLPAKNTFDVKGVGGGFLIQESDTIVSDGSDAVVTTKAPTAAELKDLAFAMTVVKHVKSNAIVIVKDGQTIGIGGGEVSRIWAANAALERAGQNAHGAVMASDAFFPFPDVVEEAAEAGITAIIQPGGSKNDDQSIAVCNEQNISMVLTNVRHFKH